MQYVFHFIVTAIFSLSMALSYVQWYVGITTMEIMAQTGLFIIIKYFIMKNVIIYNYTPHEVVIVDDNGIVVRTLPSVGLIRLKSETERIKSLDGIPVSRTVFGAAAGLPEPVKGIYYIVSQLVKNAYPKRKDFLVPAEVVRDDNGVIIGCKSLGI